MGRLGHADQEGEAAGRSQEAGGDWQDGVEALHGAEGDGLKPASGKGFGADVLYIDVRQCKRAGNLAKERRFFLIGLDEGKGDLRRPEFNRKARESGSGTKVS